MGGEVVLPLLFLLAQNDKKNGVVQVFREGYNLEWDSLPREATAEREQFVFKFVDGEKKYLRAMSLRNNERVVSVQLVLREVTGKPWMHDVHIFASPTHHSVPSTEVTIATWTGDQPFKGEVRVDVRGNEVDDNLNCAICYEVKV